MMSPDGELRNERAKEEKSTPQARPVALSAFQLGTIFFCRSERKKEEL